MADDVEFVAVDVPYDYRELSFHNYREADRLLKSLVAIRKGRHMTQTDLARAMNVSQSYISQIERGATDLLSRLNDYAIEVGASLTLIAAKAEEPMMEGVSRTSIPSADNRLSTGWDSPQSQSTKVNAFTTGSMM